MSHSDGPGWSPADLAVLQKAVKVDRLTAVEIVPLLGGRFSRNAIIGKVARLREGNGKVPPDPEMILPGIPAGDPRHLTRNRGGRPRKEPRPAPSLAGTTESPAGASEADPAAMAGPQIEKAAAKALALAWTPPKGVRGVKPLDREPHMCKWPIGDPRDKEAFHFCGALRWQWGKNSADDLGPPYCVAHMLMSGARVAA